MGARSPPAGYEPWRVEETSRTRQGGRPRPLVALPGDAPVRRDRKLVVNSPNGVRAGPTDVEECPLRTMLQQLRVAPGTLVVAAAWQAYAAELGATDLAAISRWGDVKYVGLVLLPPAWFAFAALFAGRGSWVNGRNLALLAIHPLVMLLLLANTATHDLVRWYPPGVAADPDAVAAPGLLFWPHLVYSGMVMWGSLVLDPLHRVVDANPPAERLLGLPVADAIGRPLAELLPEAAEAARNPDTGGNGLPEELVLTRDGATRRYEPTVVAMTDREGPPIGWLVVLRDVTEHHRALRHLDEQHRSLLERVVTSQEQERRRVARRHPRRRHPGHGRGQPPAPGPRGPAARPPLHRAAGTAGGHRDRERRAAPPTRVRAAPAPAGRGRAGRGHRPVRHPGRRAGRLRRPGHRRVGRGAARRAAGGGLPDCPGGPGECPRPARTGRHGRRLVPHRQRPRMGTTVEVWVPRPKG